MHFHMDPSKVIPNPQNASSSTHVIVFFPFIPAASPHLGENLRPLHGHSGPCRRSECVGYAASQTLHTHSAASPLIAVEKLHVNRKIENNV